METLQGSSSIINDIPNLSSDSIPKPKAIDRQFRKEPGVGVELEFFVLDDQGAPLEKIKGNDTATHVIHHVRERFPSEGRLLWCEEASFHLEAISDAKDNVRQAVEQTMNVVDAVNTIVRPHGGHAVLRPVPAYPFQFVKSPSPRADALLADPSWREKRWYTAIASTQINDALLFADCKKKQERWVRALNIMNSLTPRVVAEIMAHDTGFVNHEGKTRLQILRELIPGNQKWAAFQSHGFTNPDHVLYPPEFDDLNQYQSWVRAHGRKPEGFDLNQILDKDIHAGVCKVKRGINESGVQTGAPWIAEFRTMGSHGQTVDEVLEHIRPVSDHINELKAKFGL